MKGMEEMKGMGRGNAQHSTNIYKETKLTRQFEKLHTCKIVEQGIKGKQIFYVWINTSAGQDHSLVHNHSNQELWRRDRPHTTVQPLEKTPEGTMEGQHRH